MIPLDMDVPPGRRPAIDLPNHMLARNVAWLLRNLGVRNSDHPEFDRVMENLKILRKEIDRDNL
jgi:hypothetical protein